MVTDVQFSIGTSSTTASGSGGASAVDLSLDDMIKNRRKEQAKQNRKGASARKPSVADRVVGRGRAKRAAAVKARRGIKPAAKASSMEIEREVYRQSRRTAQSKEASLRRASGGRLPKKSTPARRRGNQKSDDGNKKQSKQQSKKQPSVRTIPPAWVAGTRRPPSRKAVTAAVNAMSDAGFNVPQGMQMVIGFAPAPDSDPSKRKQNKQNKSKTNSNANNKSKAGGRKK